MLRILAGKDLDQVWNVHQVQYENPEVQSIATYKIAASIFRTIRKVTGIVSAAFFLAK